MSGAINLPVVSKFDPTGIRKAEGAIKGFGSQVAKLGGIVAGAFSVAAVTNFARESVSAASDLQESLNAVTVSFGQASDAVIKLGEDASSRLGLTQTAFNQAAVRFSAFADRIVGEGGNTAGFIDDITTRAADFASVFNIDVSEALQVFQSGLAGEAEPLKRFGINLLQSEVEAYALRSGLIAVGETMTEQQKVQARYGLLLETTAKTAGDFANTSDGLANSQRILQATFTDMQATVGTALLPAIASIAQAMIPIIQEAAPMLEEAFQRLEPAVVAVAAVIPELLSALMPVIPILTDLAILVADVLVGVMPTFTAILEALIPVLHMVVDAFRPIIQAILPVFVEILDLVMAALMPIIEALLPVLLELITALAPVMLRLIEAFLPLIELILPILIEYVEFLIPLIEWVAELFSVIMVAAIGLFIDGIGKLSERLANFTEFFKTTFEAVRTFFGFVINSMISGFEAFVNAIIGGVNGIISALNRIQVKVPDWVPRYGGKKFGINISKVPTLSLPRVALAEGGIITRPTSALIGEAGPEAVIPLSKAGGLGGTYNITVNAGIGTNGAEVGRQVVNAIKDYERRNGKVFATA